MVKLLFKSWILISFHFWDNSYNITVGSADCFQRRVILVPFQAQPASIILFLVLYHGHVEIFNTKLVTGLLFLLTAFLKLLAAASY